MSEPYISRKLTEQYLDALVRRDPEASYFVMENGLQQGLTPSELLVEVIAKAQSQIGELWHSGRLNIAEEHYATQISLSNMEKLRQRIQPSNKWGIRIAVSSIEGNSHYLGARMVSDLFTLDGWDVDFLGPDTPVHDLVEFVRAGQHRLVALSVTLKEDLLVASQAVTELRKLPNPPHIMLGGYATTNNTDDLEALDGVTIAVDGMTAIKQSQNLFNLTRAPMDLTGYLVVMGNRIQEIRKTRGWNQDQLAQRAGLDRTYISAVENGKQNITLAAVLKLSESLDIPLSQLLAE